YDDPYEDYLEMFIQYGYMCMFSCALPLAGVFCLINNVMEIRSDAFKLCTGFRRPFGTKVSDIGVWQMALEGISCVAVTVNVALLGVSGAVSRWFPSLSPAQVVLLLVLFEHIVLVLKYIIAKAIPDVPHWIEEEIAITEHKKRAALKCFGAVLHAGCAPKQPEAAHSPRQKRHAVPLLCHPLSLLALELHQQALLPGPARPGQRRLRQIGACRRVARSSRLMGPVAAARGFAAVVCRASGGAADAPVPVGAHRSSSSCHWTGGFRNGHCGCRPACGGSGVAMATVAGRGVGALRPPLRRPRGPVAAEKPLSGGAEGGGRVEAGHPGEALGKAKAAAPVQPRQLRPHLRFQVGPPGVLQPQAGGPRLQPLLSELRHANVGAVGAQRIGEVGLEQVELLLQQAALVAVDPRGRQLRFRVSGHPGRRERMLECDSRDGAEQTNLVRSGSSLQDSDKNR
uniref:Anoctamin n=1 Tax=Macrostomum lignano TaxID=282301 RepID=A0A1I8JFF5_9PLAT